MPIDVMNQIIATSGNFQGAAILYAQPNGDRQQYTRSSNLNNINVSNVETKYTTRFDDPDYYHT